MRNVFVLDIQEESEIWSLYCICDKNYASATPHTGSAAYMVLYQVVESMYWSKKFIKVHYEYHCTLLLWTCMQNLSLWMTAKVLVSALVTLVSIMFPLILNNPTIQCYLCSFDTSVGNVCLNHVIFNQVFISQLVSCNNLSHLLCTWINPGCCVWEWKSKIYTRVDMYLGTQVCVAQKSDKVCSSLI